MIEMLKNTRTPPWEDETIMRRIRQAQKEGLQVLVIDPVMESWVSMDQQMALQRFSQACAEQKVNYDAVAFVVGHDGTKEGAQRLAAAWRDHIVNAGKSVIVLSRNMDMLTD